MLYRCPRRWDKVYKDLCDASHDKGFPTSDCPPIPLILSGWWHSSAAEKHQRWEETVVWARERGLDSVVESLGDVDFYTWDHNEPAVQEPEYVEDEFLVAVNDGDIQKAGKLAQDGCCTSGRNSEGFGALCLAVQYQDVPMIEFLLSIPRVKVEQGAEALLLAASHDNPVDALDLLLGVGVDPNVEGDDSWSALTNAAYLGRPEAVHRLIRAGAKVDHVDRSGMTPLIHAACRGDSSIVSALLAAGADASVKDNEGLTAKDRASQNSHSEIVLVLEGWSNQAL